MYDKVWRAYPCNVTYLSYKKYCNEEGKRQCSILFFFSYFLNYTLPTFNKTPSKWKTVQIHGNKKKKIQFLREWLTFKHILNNFFILYNKMKTQKKIFQIINFCYIEVKFMYYNFLDYYIWDTCSILKHFIWNFFFGAKN